MKINRIACLFVALLLCITMITGCGETSTDASTDTSADISTDTSADVSTDSSAVGSESSEQAASEDQASDESGVQITENYTFYDPEDLEFDTRYVLYMGPESSLVAPTVEKGELCQYTIIYAKEDTAVAEYSLYVCDSAESAQTIRDEMESYGMVADLVEEDNTVISSYSDEAVIEANLSVYQMAELVDDTTASAYVDMYVSQYGATMVEG